MSAHQHAEAQTELGKRMLARADRDNLALDHPLRVLAHAFETATVGYYADPQTCDSRKYLGCWARARRAWCDYAEEPLA